MGKEWLNWGGGGGGGGGSGSSNSGKKRRSRGGGGGGGGVMEEASTARGCMCAVFNFWDLHHLPFTFPHHHARPSLSPDGAGDGFLQDEPDGRRKGLEAPRNSLELNAIILEPSSISSSTMKHDENLNIPMNIRIRTNCETKSSPRGSTSSCRANNTKDLSPGIKPPNLVARLMGLDLLPDQAGSQTGSPSSFSRQSTSPSLTNRSTHSSHPCKRVDTNANGTVSLPETPRISLARKSDVDHHRLSLQNIEERLDVSIYGVRKMGRKSLEEESAAQYAKRIVKRMKEKVGRRVGVDITNTVSNRNDDNLVVLKPKKMSNPLRKFKEDSSSSNQSTPSCSPRLSFLDHNKKKSPLANTNPVKKNQDPRSTTLSSDVSMLKETVSQVHRPQVQVLEISRNKHKPIRTEKRATKPDVIRNKKDEPFIRTMTSNRANVSNKKLKKSAPSKELFNISAPTLMPKRKDLSLPITHFNDKQESDAPSVKKCTQSPTFSYKEEKLLATKAQPFQENKIIQPNFTSKSNNSVTESDYYRCYIQRILKRIGIDEDTPVSLAKWYSPTHPLDPSVFHYLELFQPTCFGPMKLSRRCERKLVFHLVDELLVKILKLDNPWGVMKNGQFRGAELIDVLCKKVGGFPGTNCQVLEDIDALIYVDLRGLELGKPVLFEDFESTAVDIEHDIVEKLVDETVRLFLLSQQNDYNGLSYNALFH